MVDQEPSHTRTMRRTHQRLILLGPAQVPDARPLGTECTLPNILGPLHDVPGIRGRDFVFEDVLQRVGVCVVFRIGGYFRPYRPHDLGPFVRRWHEPCQLLSCNGRVAARDHVQRTVVRDSHDRSAGDIVDLVEEPSCCRLMGVDVSIRITYTWVLGLSAKVLAEQRKSTESTYYMVAVAILKVRILFGIYSVAFALLDPQLLEQTARLIVVVGVLVFLGVGDLPAILLSLYVKPVLS